MTSSQRKPIDTKEAKHVLGGSEPRTVSGVAFPPVTVAGPIEDLTLNDCDLRQVRFARHLFGSVELRRCHFQHVDLRNQTIRGAVIVDSTLAECSLGGSIVSARFVDVVFQSTLIRDIDLENVAFEDCRIHDSRLEDMTWTRGVVRSTHITGELVNVNWRRISFDDADLSGLHMQQVALVEPVGSVALPQYADSFVVEYDAFDKASQEIRASIGTRSYDAFREIVNLHAGSRVLVVDDTFFRWSDSPDLGGITTVERRAILSALYGYRLARLPS